MSFFSKREKVPAPPTKIEGSPEKKVLVGAFKVSALGEKEDIKQKLLSGEEIPVLLDFSKGEIVLNSAAPAGESKQQIQLSYKAGELVTVGKNTFRKGELTLSDPESADLIEQKTGMTAEKIRTIIESRIQNSLSLDVNNSPEKIKKPSSIANQDEEIKRIKQQLFEAKKVPTKPDTSGAAM